MASKEQLIQNIVNAVKKQAKLEQVYVGNNVGDIGIKNWVKLDIWALDWIIGGRGLPCGRVIEAYGDFSSGKTWFTYLVLAKAQKAGMVSVLIETEGAFAPDFAKSVGVDIDKLILIRPKSVENVFEAVGALFNVTDVPIAIGWDSIAATPTEHELEKGMEVKDMSKAQKMGQGLRLITNHIEEVNGLLIAVNQVRDKIGVLFGDKEFTPGGRAMEFHASLRLKFMKAGKLLNNNKEVIGQRLKIECTKSKVCVPFRWVEVEFIYGKPIEPWAGILGIMQRRGMVVEMKGWNQFIGDTEKWRDSQFGEVLERNEVGKRLVRELLGVVDGMASANIGG